MSAASEDREYRKMALRDSLASVLLESRNDPLLAEKQVQVIQLVNLVRASMDADAEKCGNLLGEAAELARQFPDECESIHDVLTEAYSFMFSTKVMVID